LAINADGSPHSLKIAEDNEGGEGGHRHTTARRTMLGYRYVNVKFDGNRGNR